MRKSPGVRDYGKPDTWGQRLAREKRLEAFERNKQEERENKKVITILENQVIPLPEEAPEKYRGVITDGAPIDFFIRVYGVWLGYGVIDRELLEVLDKNLVQSIYSYKKRNPEAQTLKDLGISKNKASKMRLKYYGTSDI